ncbi:hypothetical protein RMSM_05910 [Rhodopirellula maiorica SM1]|uniref:Uncharacterized protein n=1 Tax=Rhodopirellula maiorica SM1 TaxID=1265738 RepID=M5RCQ2_9BACT|nr:DUF2786 domain-containing protein [Rhodopirellula maiorica]EMI17165.1 hypothetical protein RMSM_05910 [Rhodopirellula maiorica SM1]
MEFIWNDGGRAASGFVGLTGDCVTRSIAIATGTSYRDVYRDLGEVSNKSPRNGVSTHHSDAYLKQLRWQYTPGRGQKFAASVIPKGIVVVHLEMPDRWRHGHFCTVIDHVIHDTWNPSDEPDYQIAGYWTCEAVASETTLPRPAPGSSQNAEQVTTQKEFDKILHRLRALDSTANNHASTEGEKRNALRMMQNLMLRHNLSREDIHDDDNVESVCFTRRACPVNGRRACAWEKWLAAYLVKEIFPMTGWYFGVKGNRTLFWFYGPVEDVENCITLFRELLLTIATAAQLQYRGHSRGSGASYAEGYVRGLPRHNSPDDSNTTQPSDVVSETALVHARTMAVQDAARKWLRLECGVSIVTTHGSGRNQHDPAAADRGKRHGAKHDVTAENGRKRIGFS